MIILHEYDPQHDRQAGGAHLIYGTPPRTNTICTGLINLSGRSWTVSGMECYHGLRVQHLQLQRLDTSGRQRGRMRASWR